MPIISIDKIIIAISIPIALFVSFLDFNKAIATVSIAKIKTTNTKKVSIGKDDEKYKSPKAIRVTISRKMLK